MIRLRAPSLSVPLLILLVSCLVSSSSGAGPGKSFQDNQASSFNVEGKIHTLGKNTLTLNSEENMIFHVNYDDKTEFKSDDGSPASSTDLKVGLRIRVAGDFTESGAIAARTIEVLKAPPKK